MFQCATPLNELFFSSLNIDLLQRGIRQSFKDKTGISIDTQSRDDLLALMKVVFIDNSNDHYSAVREQVRLMNDIVIKKAMGQVSSGVSQYIGYRNDIESLKIPFAVPINTSTYGKKIDMSESYRQIGM